jgi:hypothetical protein
MAKKTKPKDQKFNYAVGQYWEGNSGSVGCYMSGSEVHFGTLKEAKAFRDYCNKQPSLDNEPRDYKIFMLVEVPV